MDTGKASKSDAPGAGNAIDTGRALLIGDAKAMANVLPQEPSSNHLVSC